MKTLIASTILFLMSSMAFSQSVDKVEAQAFWETNIQAILNENVDEVVSKSHFPMSTFEGDWTKDDFIDAFEILFGISELTELKTQTFHDIQPVEYEPGEIEYMVVIVTETEIDGELYESATILSFKKFDGVWKLYAIDMAG